MADYFAAVLDDDRIDRRVKRGAKDRGDLAGLRIHGKRIVAECKNVVKMALGTWAAEAEVERGNDDALAGVIIHKRHGKGKAGDQWVTMTAANFAALLSGEIVADIVPETPQDEGKCSKIGHISNGLSGSS